jgi:hypothetical protein
MRNHLRRSVTLAASCAILVATLVVAQASPALADTSQATAQAALLQIGGGTVLTTGQVSATNDGTQAAPGTVTGNTAPALSLLGSQDLLAAGVLVQQAVANPTGTSAACAGVVGNGGLVQIGPGGACTFGAQPSGGVRINLGTTLVFISADAILAECTANSNGTVTGKATLVNARINVIGPTPISLDLSPAPNTNVTVPGIVSLVLNKQSTPSGPGSIMVTALDLNLLSSTAHLALGTVTCGPNAKAPPIPVIPVKGMPFAAATVAAAGLVFLGVRRRRGSRQGGVLDRSASSAV